MQQTQPHWSRQFCTDSTVYIQSIQYASSLCCTHAIHLLKFSVATLTEVHECANTSNIAHANNIYTKLKIMQLYRDLPKSNGHNHTSTVA